MNNAAGDPMRFVVAEVGRSAGDDAPAERSTGGARPFSARVAAALLLVTVLALATVLGALAHRSRTITRTVLTAGPGLHGVDARGCPVPRSCAIIGYPAQPVMDAVMHAFALTAVTGATTIDTRTGAVYRVVAWATTGAGATILVQSQCEPGGVRLRSTGPTVQRTGAAATITRNVAGTAGCSASIAVRTRTAAAAQVAQLVSLVTQLGGDPAVLLKA